MDIVCKVSLHVFMEAISFYGTYPDLADRVVHSE